MLQNTSPDLTYGLQFLANVKGDASISPLNMRAAFGMLYAGAYGNTYKELSEVFKFATNAREVIEGPGVRASRQDRFGALREIIRLLNEPHKDYELNAANGVWFDKSLSVKSTFQDRLTDAYQAEAQTVPLRANSDAERLKINQWVSDKTKAKIPELFASGTIDNLTAMVLASALYFKADWMKKFDATLTKPSAFEGSTKKAHMMRRGQADKTSPKLYYAEFDGAQVVEIPYKNRELNNISILPPKGTSVEDLEAHIIKNGLPYTSEATFTRLEIPRHKMSGDYDLKPILLKMGLTDAFDLDRADFSGITKEPIAIGTAVHKTDFVTNEEGSEGAAATGISMMLKCCVRPTKNVEFVADRPYLELISHPAGILFINRIVSP